MVLEAKVETGRSRDCCVLWVLGGTPQKQGSGCVGEVPGEQATIQLLHFQGALGVTVITQVGKREPSQEKLSFPKLLIMAFTV